jgi:radical SAM superfamily enzyme YgiQ (UPF0313 family)
MTRPHSVLLADLIHPNTQLKTFPYAAACVGAYAADRLGSAVAVSVYCTPEDLGAAFAARRPAVLGLTNYVWNCELGYEVVRQAKAAAPDVVVVMGGPNYPAEPDAQAAFFAAYPLIDFYVYKEGEIPFVALLGELERVGFDAAALRAARPPLPGVHYVANGALVAPEPAPRERALDRFPSPYLTGLLDPFFARGDLAPILQTKRGCPFACTFCVEGERYYTKLASVTTARFRAELEYIAAHMRDGGMPVLHIADSNFGMYEHDLEICDAIAAVRARYGWPATIEVSTGKNRKERVLEAVRRTGGAMRFGPALQSTDPHTLATVKRANISEHALIEMASAAADLDQRSYTELILGLPGDTVRSHCASIRAAMDAGLQRIKLYPLVLLPGTEMAGREARRTLGLDTRFRVLPQSHGTYRFVAEPFASAEVVEVVIATASMRFDEYLACKRFGLSVEIFYNDGYLHEIHGLMRALGLSMFAFVERCHARCAEFPPELQRLYAAVEQGVVENLWPTREACLAHHRDPAALARYAAEEHKTSVGTLKALALLDHIEPILAIAGDALRECVRDADPSRRPPPAYVDELLEYSRLRRMRPLDVELEPRERFGFAFDRLSERGFRADPRAFRLAAPRQMRFWHDPAQRRQIRALCQTAPTPAVRARSFIYPPSDPAVNPYLRRAAFC